MWIAPTPAFLAVQLAVFIAGLAVNAALLRALGKGRWFNAMATAVLTLWLIIAIEFGLGPVLGHYQWVPELSWVRALGLLWIIMGALALPVIRAHRNSQIHPGAFDSSRRRVIQAAGLAAVAAPIAAGRVGFLVGQRDAMVKEVALPIANLPPDLQGFRIVQISDIHMSPFLSRAQFARTVDAANSLGANLTLVTGDLITSPGDPLDDCLAELRRLRAEHGVYGCMGNHEIYAQSEDYTAAQGHAFGLRFLRHERALIEVGGARLNLAGVDYQRKSQRHLLGARGLQRDGAVNILMSHNPDVFPVAAQQGWDATIAGHTHGGQVTLEYLHTGLNPARFITPYVYGLYRKGPSSMFVTSGLGTVTLPVRLGVPPEIALITLTS